MAFRDLMQAHAGMVLATARRITRDAAMAEDVVQETFLQLARQSQQVTESVAAWLHRVAWRRACNAVRDDATRRRHEDLAVAETVTAAADGAEASWAEVEAELDAVVNELPDNLRAPLVMHFLEGRSQREIAKELKQSQSTVSRAIDAGLVEVRSRLKSKGMLCGAGLGAMIAAQSASASAVSAGLMMSLSKLGMSGIGGIGATAAGASALAVMSLSLKAKLSIAAAAAVLVGTVVTVKLAPRFQHSTPAVTTQAQSVPNGEEAKAQPGVAKVDPNISSQANNAPSANKAGMGYALASMSKLLANASAASMALAASHPTPAVEAVAAPVHELVHSFPLPARRPRGHIVMDAEGWIWGANGSGGNYGQGTIYKMRPDGSGWQEVVSFNGISGVPRGAYPIAGVMRAADGALWGTTGVGGAKNQGTLFRYDPRTAELDTMAEFEGAGQPWAVPTEAPDGQFWGTTHYTVYRFNPVNRQLVTVFRGSGKTGKHPGTQFQSELVADGKGYFWGTAEAGGAANLGVLFKVNIATGEATTVVQFTGKKGAFPGAMPIAALTLDKEGFLWGTTHSGGSADRGTVFKIQADTGGFATVAEFKARPDDNPGSFPETQLIADGEGHFWGTTISGGRYGSGTVFKLDAQTGALNSVVTFTGLEGAVRGGPARGHLFDDGAGGFIGACDYGGTLGTIFRVETKTGKYKELINVSDLPKKNEGHDLHGTLVAGAGDWLWGMAAGGAHHYGTIYKFNAVTNELVNVIDFTGTSGPFKGRVVDAGLVSDGQGFLWGTTTRGGTEDQGTVFKIQESTGAFTTVAESTRSEEGGLGFGPASALVPDGKGFMWGTTFWTVYKIDMQTLATTTVATFDGDKGPHYGSGGLGRLALDDRGFLWGCSQTDNKRSRACLFKIDSATDAFTTLAEFKDANSNWSHWHSSADMYWDGKGFMWFTGVIDGGSRKAQASLFKVNTRTGVIEGRYRQEGYGMIGAPTMDENGVLWGGALDKGYIGDGSVYTFDTRTQKFATVLAFTGQGSQAASGHEPQEASLLKHRDGNFYGITRVGGPGNGGTVYRLRYGPTPMTQEAVLLADGSVALHGTLTPNGLDSEAAFEWGTTPDLLQAATVDAGWVSAGNAARPVGASLTKLQSGTTYYFRLRGSNAANRIAQRGAVLSFTTPALNAGAPGPALADHATSGADAAINVAANAVTTRYPLKINRIPGAGAGFVTGGLTGAAYEVGKRYSITALADNDYIFDHWSGPGISGARAEGRVLSFVFTAELADSPVITATFVRNPFHDEAIGSFNGLVLAAEGVAPEVGNTGALRVDVTHTGTFTGVLHYDGDVIPLAGAFDAGGLARFGPARAASWTITRTGKPVLTASLQLDLSPSGPHEILGTIGSVSGSTVADRSVVTAARSYYDGRQHWVPAQYFATQGRFDLAIIGSANDEAAGLVRVTSAGSATFAARLSDGTGVVAQAPLSQMNQAAFFAPLYAKRIGSIGGTITLDALLQQGAAGAQPFWWARADRTWQDLTVRNAAGGSAE